MLNQYEISIIIPVFNEQEYLPRALKAVKSACPRAELIVVDGGSADRTVVIARQYGAKVLISCKGRAVQMNAGAGQAHGDILVFFPADSIPGKDFFKGIKKALAMKGVVGGGFRVRFDDPNPFFRVVEFSSNFRARFLKIFYLDQGLFVKRSVFEKVGGFPQVGVMEETELCNNIKKVGYLSCCRSITSTSPRRFFANGPVKTWLIMGMVRFLHWCHVPPSLLCPLWDCLRMGVSGR